jgi:hypothetical protein
MRAWGHLGQGGAGGRSPPPPQEVPPGLRSCMCAEVTWRAALHGLHAVGAGGCSPSRAGGVTDRLQQQLPLGLQRQRRGWSAAPTSSPLQQLGVPPPPSGTTLSRRDPRPPPQRPPPRVGVGNGSPRPHHLESAPLPPPPEPLHRRASALPAGASTVALAHDRLQSSDSVRPRESSKFPGYLFPDTCQP